MGLPPRLGGLPPLAKKPLPHLLGRVRSPVFTRYPATRRVIPLRPLQSASLLRSWNDEHRPFKCYTLWHQAGKISRVDARAQSVPKSQMTNGSLLCLFLAPPLLAPPARPPARAADGRGAPLPRPFRPRRRPRSRAASRPTRQGGLRVWGLGCPLKGQAFTCDKCRDVSLERAAYWA